MSKKEFLYKTEEELEQMTTEELINNVEISFDLVKEEMVKLLNIYSHNSRIAHEVKEYEGKIELLEIQLASLKEEYKRKTENK